MRKLSRTLVATLLVLALSVVFAPPGIAGGPEETIGVHGHWVIEVRDPDGGMAARREFHNALVANNPITQILTSQRSAGPLEINLGCTGVGCAPLCPGQICRIVEPRLPGPPTAVIFKNLTVVNFGVGFELQGSIVAAVDSTIGLVNSLATTCLPSAAPSTCNFGLAGSLLSTLTGGSVSPAVPVATGQQVLVTVTITFATAAAAPATTQGVAPPR